MKLELYAIYLDCIYKHYPKDPFGLPRIN
jgi:hypothetical protein